VVVDKAAEHPKSEPVTTGSARPRRRGSPARPYGGGPPLRMVGVASLITVFAGLAGLFTAPAAWAGQDRALPAHPAGEQRFADVQARVISHRWGPGAPSSGVAPPRAPGRASYVGPAAARAAGGGWRVEPSPNPAIQPNGIAAAVSCASSAACMLVGNYAKGTTDTHFIAPLAERWNGTRWAIQAIPSPAGALVSQFNAVSCVSPGACTAVGSTSAHGRTRPLAEAWNGTRWAIQAIPSPAGAISAYLFGVSCTAPDACTAAGDSEQPGGVFSPLAERWDGTNWAIQATPTPAPTGLSSGFFAVSCTAPAACTATGGYTASNGDILTLAESWDGTAWMVQATPSPAGAFVAVLVGVSCTTSGGCVAAGYNEGGSVSLYATLAESWNGTAWTIQAMPAFPKDTAPSLSAVSCTSPSNCVAVGSNAGHSKLLTLAESWNGTAWRVDHTPHRGTNQMLSGVSCPGAQACIAAGSGFVSGYLPLADAWNGTAWRAQAIPAPGGSFGSGLRAVSCPAADACVAVGTSFVEATSFSRPNRSPALAEYWNGHRWRILAAPVSGRAQFAVLTGVWCTSPRACTAVGYYQSAQRQLPLAETWNGTGWTRQPMPAPAPSKGAVLTSVSCAARRSCAAVGYSFSTSDPANETALTEIRTGTRWASHPAAAPTGILSSNLQGVWCTKPGICTAVGSYTATPETGATLAETWNGTRWSLQPTPSQGYMLDAVSCTTARACTAVGLGAGPLAEAWNGTRWRVQPAPKLTGTKFDRLTGVFCTSAARCTAVGEYEKTGLSPFKAFAETWNGTRWTPVATPNPAGIYQSTLAGVWCNPPSACTAIGSFEFHTQLESVAGTLVVAK
jgi:hypothetical protein